MTFNVTQCGNDYHIYHGQEVTHFKEEFNDDLS